jgi:hypothetical protein
MINRKQFIQAASLAAVVGFLSGKDAEGAADPLQGITGSPGETSEALEKAAALNISDYEPEDKEGGGGAYQKTLVDNDKIKVIIAAYKKGFMRPGGFKRRYNTLLVYIDPGRYTITKTGAGTAVASPKPAKLAPGSSVFHRKNSIVSELIVDEDYRVVYVEMKS